VCPVTELRQCTAKFEDLEGLVGHLGAIQLRRGVDIERPWIDVEDQHDRLADRVIRLVERA
jgi:hypothetical protein